MPIKSVIRRSQKNGKTPSEKKKPKRSINLETTKKPRDAKKATKVKKPKKPKMLKKNQRVKINQNNRNCRS